MGEGSAQTHSLTHRPMPSSYGEPKHSSSALWGQFLQPDLSCGRRAQPPDIEEMPFFYRDATWEASCTIVPDTREQTSGSDRLAHDSGEVEWVQTWTNMVITEKMPKAHEVPKMNVKSPLKRHGQVNGAEKQLIESASSMSL